VVLGVEALLVEDEDGLDEVLGEELDDDAEGASAGTVELVDPLAGNVVDDGTTTGAVDAGVFRNRTTSSTVTATTPSTVATATCISRRVRTGAPCASRRSGRRRLLIGGGSYR
jgi:hypothetical protein